MIRLCEDCGHHEAMRDGRKCRDCMNAYLRATRPAFTPEWIKRARERRLSTRIEGGSAA
jgi:hypothetical protein